MKRWALLAVTLYGVTTAALALPLFMAYGEGATGLLVKDFLILLPILLCVNAVLLLIPLDIAHDRPIGRRKIVLSTAVGAIPMALLVTLFVGCWILLLWGEQAAAAAVYGRRLLLFLALAWLCWTWGFYRLSREQEAAAVTRHIAGWLLKGSLLELLIAVPAHIVAREREECCAPPFALLGIATGIAVALLAFGPGLFLLFAGRVRDKRRGNR